MVAAIRLKQRLSGHVESQEEIAVPPAPVNALLSGLLAIEAAALRVVNMPLGSFVAGGGHEAVGLTGNEHEPESAKSGSRLGHSPEHDEGHEVPSPTEPSARSP